MRGGDWVVKAEAHGTVRMGTGARPGLGVKEGFLLPAMAEERPANAGKRRGRSGRGTACAKTLRLGGARPVPGTESRPGGPEPAREERGCQMRLEVVSQWRRLGFILGAVGI